MILCTARTGSTWLHTLLNAHLNIHSQGEIIGKRDKNSKVSFGAFAFRTYPAFVRAVGLKVFYDLTDYKEALQYVRKSDIKIILLTRESLLEQFVSLKKASITNQWSSTKATDGRKLRIDLQEFLSFKETRKNTLVALKQELTNKEVFQVSYEDLLENPDAKLNELQRFLGVTPQKLRSVLKKQSVEPISRQIENWEEIKNQL